MDKYHEPAEATAKLFRLLDNNHDGFITIEDLALTFRSIHLHPPLKEIKAILGQAGTLKLNYQQVTKNQFQTLRASKKRCELNVIAEFKKFEDKVHKGYITQRSIEDALFCEGIARAEIASIVATLMNIDKNRDGFITYKQLFDFLMGILPEEWIKWLISNADRGIATDKMIEIIQEHGLNGKAAEDFLNAYLDIKARG